jgi:hypothetical protein
LLRKKTTYFLFYTNIYLLLARKPIEEAQKSGTLGFFKGVGLGLVGVAVKPVIGLTDGISSIASGFTQQLAKDSLVVTNARPQRAFERSRFDLSCLVLVPVDIFAAEAQQYILKVAKSNCSSDSFRACINLGFSRESIENSHSYALCLTDGNIFLLSKICRSLWTIPLGDVSHFILESETTINFVIYNKALQNSSTPTQLSKLVTFASKSSTIRAYSVLYQHAQCMGNPSAILPIDLTIVGGNNSMNKSKINDAEEIINIKNISYQFGTANLISFPNVSLSNFEVLKSATESLISKEEDQTRSSDRDYCHKILDQKVWQLVSNWRNNHYIFNPSRCLACIVLNYSSNNIQILETKLLEGENVIVIGVGSTYDEDSRCISPGGGSAVIFGYGYTPSLTDLAHVKVISFSFTHIFFT